MQPKQQRQHRPAAHALSRFVSTLFRFNGYKWIRLTVSSYPSQMPWWSWSVVRTQGSRQAQNRGSSSQWAWRSGRRVRWAAGAACRAAGACPCAGLLCRARRGEASPWGIVGEEGSRRRIAAAAVGDTCLAVAEGRRRWGPGGRLGVVGPSRRGTWGIVAWELRGVSGVNSRCF
jgi:hypothetical protein